MNFEIKEILYVYVSPYETTKLTKFCQRSMTEVQYAEIQKQWPSKHYKIKLVV